MLRAEVVEASRRITVTSRRLEKIDILANLASDSGLPSPPPHFRYSPATFLRRYTIINAGPSHMIYAEGEFNVRIARDTAACKKMNAKSTRC